MAAPDPTTIIKATTKLYINPTSGAGGTALTINQYEDGSVGFTNALGQKVRTNQQASPDSWAQQILTYILANGG